MLDLKTSPSILSLYHSVQVITFRGVVKKRIFYSQADLDPEDPSNRKIPENYVSSKLSGIARQFQKFKSQNWEQRT